MPTRFRRCAPQPAEATRLRRVEMETMEKELGRPQTSGLGRRAAMLLGGAAVASMALGRRASAQSSAITDSDILNFALNLEYLEAQFYTLATTGKTIDEMGIGIGAGTAPTGGGSVITKPGGPTACLVPWTLPAIQG